ncbi:MAG: hypothetical protein GEU26_05485 [Nitrososphaeraceae archaeon]|nr:hypothetical protein [Nitrososphaeraceae archaeon]
MTAFLEDLRKKHDIAYNERKEKWLKEHATVKYFNPTHEEHIKDCTFNEWVWNFIQDISKTPEQRYQEARNPRHGFGHDNGGLHGSKPFDKCVPECRFWNETGRIENLETLEDYKDYVGYYEMRKIVQEWPQHH